MKALIEKRNALLDEMDGIVKASDTETRAFTEVESTRFDEIKMEIAAIDKTIQAKTEARSLEKTSTSEEKTTEEIETRSFAAFIRSEKVEERANLDIANNGAVVPKTIANKIITKVKELSPIYSMATIYNVKGELVFPVYGNAADDENITCAYIADMTELTEKSGKFTTVSLKNFIAGTLTKVSKSLLNNSDFDLVSFVTEEMAKSISEFLEKELIVGTTEKMTGVLSSTYGVTTASATAITADELIDLQMTVPEVYQPNAAWLMNKATFKGIRKLKDSNGDYIMNRDLTMGFGWSLLGKPVYISESVPAISSGAKVIAYGDMSGLYVKLSQNVEIQVLLEKYATQHAIGIVGYVECDSNIVEPQKLAVMTMKTA